MSPENQSVADTSASKPFPYGLEDIESWVIKRKDGTSVRYVLEDPGSPKNKLGAKILDYTSPKSLGPAASYAPTHGSYGDLCHHTPVIDGTPVFIGTNPATGAPINLFIADAPGTRLKWKEFDILLDCGEILSSYDYATKKILNGDPALVGALQQHSLATTNHCRVLKIDWIDRKAPDLDVAFWGDLIKVASGNVLCSCQGGHGRSGTSLVCLMMALSDYTALESLTHLRAFHCSRAIESGIQHEYIDKVAAYLGRTKDSSSTKVDSYRDRFLASTNPLSAPAQAALIARGAKA